VLLSLANCTGNIETYRANTLILKDVVRMQKRRTLRVPAVSSVRCLEFSFQLVKLADQLRSEEFSHAIHAELELAASRREERLVNECVPNYSLQTVFAVFMVAVSTADIRSLRGLSTTNTG
jgi:hypothetical protein